MKLLTGLFPFSKGVKVNKKQLEAILVGNKEIDAWLPLLTKVLPKYDINTKERIAGFLSQCAHESSHFTRLVENLNYSEKLLLQVFPKYFKNGAEQLYGRKPEAIANVVYANRMGNGNTASGDGWRYRGRGLIQLTGKNNYVMFAKAIGKTLADTVEYVQTKEGALESACWFWKTRGLNAAADKKDVELMTKLINGGRNGIESRKQYFTHAMQVLNNG